MGYCFELYTPDFKLKDTGKFVACSKLFFSNSLSEYMPELVWIGKYENTLIGKCQQLYNSLICMDEQMCEKADAYTQTTFFTNFLNNNDCNGILIRVI